MLRTIVIALLLALCSADAAFAQSSNSVNTLVAKSRPIRGYFSAADARAVTLTEAQAHITLYEFTGAAVTLEADEIVIITGLSFSGSAAGLDVEIYDGANDTITAQESLWHYSSITAAGLASFGSNFSPPLFCLAGTYPKVEADVTGQVDVRMVGYVYDPGD